MVGSRRPVGAVDTIWLNMDRPNNLMVIESVMWFDEPLDFDRLATVVRRRLLDRYPVFGQHPVGPPSGLGIQYWEADPDFSLSRHLRRATLPAPGDEVCLQRYVEQQMSRRFDREHPLWEMHLVEGYRGGAALVARFHHCLADGMALAEVLLSLTDPTPDGDLEEAEGSGASVSLAGRGLSPWLPLGAARRLAAAAPSMMRPSAVRDVLTLARQTGHVADKLLLGSVPTTPLSGLPGVDKRAVWSQPRSLADVKRAGRAAGATVNDVLVGAVSGAVAAYLVEHGGEPTDLTTMVPVNLRPVGQPLPRELGNRFALVLLPLATGRLSSSRRLAETKRRMDAIKSSPEAVITFGLMTAIGWTHPDVERLLVNFFSGKAIGVTTNVIGPMTDRFVAGSRIAGVLGWVPGSGRQTLGVCIFTYNRTVRVGFKTDAGIVPDPERLVEAFDAELDELLQLARTA